MTQQIKVHSTLKRDLNIRSDTVGVDSALGEQLEHVSGGEELNIWTVQLAAAS